MRAARPFLCLVLAGLLAPVLPAWGMVALQPGLWQETETGSENNQPGKVETTTRCMTAEEARQPGKAVVFDEQVRRHCRVLELNRAGDVLSFRMQCGTGEVAVNMGATFTLHTPQHYSGTIKASLKLGMMRLNADKKIDAKRIGECVGRQ